MRLLKSTIFLSPILIILLLFVFCHPGKHGMPAPVVEVLPVIKKDLPQYSEWVGTTNGLVNASIRPQVQGYLISQNYEEGSFVKKGELLFRIDDRPFKAALDQALGELNRAKAQLFIDSANLERIRVLAPQNAVSKRDLDQAIGAEKSSRNAVSSAFASVNMARLNVNFTKIKSPISGIAGIALSQKGDLVGPGQPNVLTTVSVLDPIQVNYFVSEQQYLTLFSSNDRTLLNTNQMVFELRLSDNSWFPSKGKFYAIDRQIDSRTGTIQMEALFPNPGNVLRPGQFVRIRVTTKIKSGALLIPQRAVSEIQGKTMVAVVNDSNRIEVRMITAGRQSGSLLEITNGLKQGENVVVEGIQKVKPGMLVNPKPFITDSSNLDSTVKKRSDKPVSPQSR